MPAGILSPSVLGSDWKMQDVSLMSASTNDVSSLIVAAKSGSRTALGGLLECFGARLTDRVRSVLGAELTLKIGESDVVQETLMTAALKFSGFRGRTENEFENWLTRIFYRRALDTRKHFYAAKRDVRREKPLYGSAVNRSQADDSDDSTPEGVGNFARMRDVLAGMPVVYQRVVSLSFNERKSDKDIARIMKRSVDAVRKLRYRALRLLGKKLDLSTSIGRSV